MSIPRGIRTDQEIWIPLEDFPMYEVSTFGRVRSYATGAMKNLSGTVTSFGYVAYILRKKKGGKPYRRLAHRLVAEAFIVKNSELMTDVCHNDGNPSNNNVGNLRWDTHQGNQMDMRKHGTMQDGEKCCTAKLTADQVKEIKEEITRLGRGAGVVLSKRFGVRTGQISRIKNGTRWRGLSEYRKEDVA